MRLEFIGTGTPLGQAGRRQACLRLGNVLVDCGMTSLVAGLDPTSLEAVVVTHLHGDHFGGLPLLMLDARARRPRSQPLVVYGPAMLEDRIHGFLEACGWPDVAATPGFHFQVLHDRQPVTADGYTITPFAVPHMHDSAAFALRITDGRRTLAYTGDAGWSDDLLELGKGADALVCGVWSYATPDPTFLDLHTVRSRLPHQRLILTHLGPTMLDHLAEARALYEVAEDGRVIDV